MTALRVAERYARREHSDWDEDGEMRTYATVQPTGLVKTCTHCKRKGVAFQVIPDVVYGNPYILIVWPGRARSAEGSKGRIGCKDVTSYAAPRSADWLWQDEFGCPACFAGPWDAGERWIGLLVAHLGVGFFEVPAPSWFKEALQAEHGRRGDSDVWLRRGYTAVTEALAATSDGARRLAAEIRSTPGGRAYTEPWVKLVMPAFTRLLPYEDSPRSGRATFWSGVRSGLLQGEAAEAEPGAPRLFLVKRNAYGL